MIKVLKNEKKIEIKGHSNYDDLGKDIVCSAVSSIVTTTINGIISIDSELVPKDISRGDYIHVCIDRFDLW